MTFGLIDELAGNGYLDNQGFSPIGQVVIGMEFVDQLYELYGEGRLIVTINIVMYRIFIIRIS